jgi:hypothetical protein
LTLRVARMRRRARNGSFVLPKCARSDQTTAWAGQSVTSFSTSTATTPMSRSPSLSHGPLIGEAPRVGS